MSTSAILRTVSMLVLALAPTAFAQTTATLAPVITDRDGIVWANGKFSAHLFAPNGNPPSQGGAPVTVTASAGSFDANGTAQMNTLSRTDLVDQAGAQWQLLVCSATSAPCSRASVTVDATTTSQSLAAQITSQIAPAHFSVSTGPNAAFGYADIEANASHKGDRYWNTTLGEMRMWDGAKWIGRTNVRYASFFQGSGAPASSLGANSDSYMDTSTGDLYGKSSGTWALTGNIRTGGMVPPPQPTVTTP